MAKSSAARRLLHDQEPPVAAKETAFGGGPPPGPPVQANAPVLNNAKLGVIMMLGAEAMFFAGLIGAFIVFRLAAEQWPPPFQPRLPVGVTGVNTLILLISAFTMHFSVRAVRAGDIGGSRRFLTVTAFLGTLFLAIQGFEWIKLVHFGLTVSSSVYGGLFYTLIGAHGAHVLGALVWLVVVYGQARRGRYSTKDYNGLQICGMYWTFVVALWPVLYGLVYLY
ncbi:MAG TPA: heme-copper oxidase subunit III [Candidatus Binatia bacterium]